jgi:hypothetical protein
MIKIKDRAEPKEFARWANLVKAPDCRRGKDKRKDMMFPK